MADTIIDEDNYEFVDYDDPRVCNDGTIDVVDVDADDGESIDSEGDNE